MRKLRWLSGILTVFLLLVSATTVLAQTYLFSVDKEDVVFMVNADGTATIEYFYDFTNDPSAAPFDLVTLGLPSDNYDLGSITADVNGQPVGAISRSQYVDHGVDIALGSQTFTGGQSAKFHARIGKITNILYPATTEGVKDYASFEFSPNWFGRQYVSGTTPINVTLVLPPGLKTDEPRYFTPKDWPGSPDPKSSMDDQGRVIYSWSAEGNAFTQYTFGASFPNRLVPAGAIVQPPAFQIDFGTLCCIGFWGLIVLVIGFWIYQAIWGSRNRKLKYLPPKILVEGNGVKRGLTAVEAAIVLQEPLDKVLTMILFAVVRKGAASVTSRDPLTLKLTDPQPPMLQPYEQSFLDAFKIDNAARRRTALQDTMVALVRSVTEKMKGFSYKETVEYYKDIMTRAWTQVESAQTPEVKMENYDKYMDWAMLDKDFSGRTQNTFRTSGPIFVPMWWSNYDPGYRPAAGFGGSANVSTGGSGGGGKISVSMPNLPGADFAASITGGIQTFAAGVVGDIASFTNPVTNVTNPPPPPPPASTYRGGGGGGHSCACACACAGCACACAGGGR